MICAKPRSMAKTCSETCQHLLAEQTRQGLRDSGDYAPMASGYKLSGRKFEDRICEGCGESYTPTMPTQRFCLKKSVTKKCEFCLEDFQPRRPCHEVIQKFCSLLCGNLAKVNSKLPLEKLDEFRDIDEWAVKFLSREGRKPTQTDVEIYFSARLPGRANRDLFSFPKRSAFEDIVLGALLEFLPESMEILREKQPLRMDQRRYELDLWIPELKLAFEVQDFATHSRFREDEPASGKFKGLKRGPKYHELKRELALEQLGVVLLDIWEDEIFDGSYRDVLLEAIEAAMSRIRYDSNEVTTPSEESFPL